MHSVIGDLDLFDGGVVVSDTLTPFLIRQAVSEYHGFLNSLFIV